MLKRIFTVWLIANFVLPSLAALLVGGWYLSWQPVWVAMLAELGLMMLPNSVLAVGVLRFGWPVPVASLRSALGWHGFGWRALLVGAGGFALYLPLNALVSTYAGPSIPYQVPGTAPLTARNPLELGLLLFLPAVFVLLTVAGEETLFRGLIQTQVGTRYGAWAGLLLAAALFGLRHLPADLFYALAWQATPGMWLSRQLDFYAGALLFGLVRHFGRSTYASALMHGAILLTALFG